MNTTVYVVEVWIDGKHAGACRFFDEMASRWYARAQRDQGRVTLEREEEQSP